MVKRILIAVGGTGGHIFPAIAFADELKEEFKETEVKFIGGKLKSNSYFDREKYAYCEVLCGKGDKNPFYMIKESTKILSGVIQSLKEISKFKPDFIVGFGSYHSFPVLLAAKLAGIPIILHESNSLPGRVVRFFSPYAFCTATFFPDAKMLLKGNVRQARMPIRKFLEIKDARQYFNLNKDGFTILVFGGSQGAKVINETFYQTAITLKKHILDLQVIHLAGTEEEAKRLQHHYATAGINATVKPFEKNMAIAWGAADVVISRAGAGTIAEQIEYIVPCILIPFAAAMDDHQSSNAEFALKYGMSNIILEKDLTSEILAQSILTIQKHLPNMRQKIEAYRSITNVPSMLEIIKDINSSWKK